jgi:SAM-dependent methyltransferase
MRSLPCLSCYLCNGPGDLLYQGLVDRLFGVAGSWDLRRCINSACGLIWIDPMPLETDIGDAYRHYYTHEQTARGQRGWLMQLYLAVQRGYLAMNYGYGGETVSRAEKALGLLAYCHPGRRAVMDFSVMRLLPVPGGKLLDVGCGSGEALEFMQKLGWNATGVDFDQRAAEAARLRGVDVRVGSLESQHFPDSHFDAITMSHVIEHLHDPLRTLRECHRLLKEGGRLSIVTPNIESHGHRHYSRDWRGLEPPRHLHLFSPATLRTLVERAGFVEVSISTSIRDAYGMFIASLAVRRIGTYAVGAVQPLTMRLVARAMELGAWFRVSYEPSSGEEIALLASR